MTSVSSSKCDAKMFKISCILNLFIRQHNTWHLCCSAYYNDELSTTSSEAAMSIDDQDQRVPQLHPFHSTPITDNDDATKLNSSYYSAIDANSHTQFGFINKASELNTTLQPGNLTLDNTLTPAKLPLSPLPTNLPPPPQFGNEAISSTPRGATSSVFPPPYRQALGRVDVHPSTYDVSNSNNNNNNNNSNNNNNNNSNSPSHGSELQNPLVTTIPGNNPGNRLSFAHYQPMIFHDEDPLANDGERSTPSPTTHTLVLTSEDHMAEDPKASDQSAYSFYESEYRGVSAPSTAPTPTEPVKVTFV